MMRGPHYAEIFYGLRLLPDGRRRADLMTAVQHFFEIEIAGRI
jgi:toxin FitB